MYKLREEELDARFILERLVYRGRHFLNADKPDIHDEKGEIGVEHRLVTTPDAMRMEKYLENYLDANPEVKEGISGKTEALLLENELLDTDASIRENRWKLGLLELGLREKLEKLNEGAYATFMRNELFLTMREYMVTDGLVSAFALRLPAVQAEYRIHFYRIYIFALNDLYVMEGRAVVDKIPLHPQFLQEMEENTARLMEIASDL